ncbi:MAG TPA: peroxidase family protein, partial [Saprospiraceae bacterium]|nr:peroxidase family protein [Saprospiraceae bacterium]
MQQFDAKVIDDVRNFLFGPPGAGGLDLVAINILRGRERGLPDFNTIRAAYGLTPYSSFPQINSSSQVFSALHELYGDINNIDPWVGFVAEQQNSPQTVVGPTLQRILQVQFTALRDGDRFYYENDPVLTDEEKDIIRNTKLRDIVVRNSGLPMLQDNVFKAMPHSEICDNMHVRIYGRFRSVL